MAKKTTHNIVDYGGTSVQGYIDEAGKLDVNALDSYLDEDIIAGPLIFHNGSRMIICDSCKTLMPQGLSYTPYKKTRHICKQCTQDAFDKMFGIDNAAEKVLYGK